MTREQKAKWLEALRSGKYEQGKTNLCTRTPFGHAYCCLGVAQDLFGIDDAASCDGSGIEDSDNFIDPTFLPLPIQRSLAARNDGDSAFTDSVGGEVAFPYPSEDLGEECVEPLSFPQIADFIEQHIHPTED